jgi:phospholipase C
MRAVRRLPSVAALLPGLLMPQPRAAAAAEPDRAELLQHARAAIQHVIIIMQENRSFDSYFGTFPGANGPPQNICVPIDPSNPASGCVAPYYDPHDVNAGGPHQNSDAQEDLDDGVSRALMDGFITRQTNGKGTDCSKSAGTSACNSYLQGLSRHDVMGYHTDAEIPNYWEYAKRYVLQDQLYEGVRSWSYPSHIELTSEWTATCGNKTQAMTCYTDPEPARPKRNGNTSFPWVNLFQLFDAHGVSWKYYVASGGQPDCDDGAMSCNQGGQQPGVGSEWNPPPYYLSVQQQGGNYLALHNPAVTQFFTDLQNGTLPQVSWLIPDGGNAEHPPDSITKGMEYVTSLVNAVMQSPYWQNTAIFITWDEWGGFYDHVVPPVVDTNQTPTPVQGYGLRVPGLLISAYAREGEVDKSVLSFDSYATFIEDLFAGGARLNPSTLGNPDMRPTIRDAIKKVYFIDNTVGHVGDLLDEFNFNRAPRPPLILSTAIPTGLSVICGASKADGFLCTSSTVQISWSPVSNGTGAPPYTYYVTRDGVPVSTCVETTKMSCSDTPGSGNHLYRIYTVDSQNTQSPLSAALEADEP